ncbi:MAG: hypothetical protein KAI47_25235, partial [Deltaproteobacteria bacterium]|nr:hypothetical protein [Deltaproteobacteria bacterium]
MRFRRFAFLSSCACLLVAMSGPAWAEELGSLLQQKLAIEEQLATTVNQMLGHLVSSKRAFVSVSVDLDARVVRQAMSKGAARAMSFTVGTVSSEKYVKLPGLPRMRPGKISEPVRIRIDPQKKKLIQTSMVGVVRRLRVHLYADPKISDKRLAGLKEAIRSVAGLQKKRGDTLDVVHFDSPPPPPTRVLVPAAKPSYWLSVAALPLSLVVAALILGVAFIQSRRRDGGEADAKGRVTERISLHTDGGEADARGAGASSAEGGEADALHEAAARRRYLPVLAELSAAEVVEVFSDLDLKDAALALALAPLSARDLGAIVDELAGEERFFKVVADVAVKRTVDIKDIAALASRVDRAVDHMRNPKVISVGAPARLGDILKATSRHAARDVLASLEATKPELAAAVREHLFQFEDL